MEVFSTLPRAFIPWMANGLTAAVMLSATWWSAGQRPAALPAASFAAVSATGPAAGTAQPSSKAQASASTELVGSLTAPSLQDDASVRWTGALVRDQAVQRAVYRSTDGH